MHLSAVNPDLVIAAVLAGAALYAAAGGSGRLRSLILSTYVGIVLAGSLGALVSRAVPQLGAESATLGLFGLPVVIMALIHPRAAHPNGSAVANLVFGTATGAFIAAAALHVMPPSSAQQLAGQSFLALQLSGTYLWFVAAMPVVAVLAGAMHHLPRGRDRH